MSAQFSRGGVEEDLSQLTVIMLYHDSTGCDEMDDYFATEADTMIYKVYKVDLNKDKVLIFILLNCRL